MTETVNEAPETLILDRTNHPSAEDTTVVGDGLTKHARAKTGHDPWEWAAFLRDGNGRVMGGATCMGVARDFYVKWLWVEASLRGQGYGSRLLAAVEEEARRCGCHRITLDTFDFQAPDFYTACGYTPLGTIPDYAHGSTRIWFRKVLLETS